MPTTNNTNPDIMTALGAPNTAIQICYAQDYCVHYSLIPIKMFIKLISIKPNLSKVWKLEGSKHLLANLAWAVLLLKDLHQIEDLRML